MKKLLVVFCLLGCLAMLRGGDRIIVLGRVPMLASSHAIVIPDDVTPTENVAATELQNFLAQITGQKLAIVKASEKSSAYGLYIGRSGQNAGLGFRTDVERLGVEGIGLECRGGNLSLAGNKRGAMYAVFSFLEDYLDCHWLAPDCSVIPDHGKVVIPEFIYEFIPPLEYRDVDSINCRNFEFGVRNKLNGTYLRGNIPEGHGDFISCVGLCHTFYKLVPPSIYGKDHPEYYSERDGKRVVPENDDHPLNTQLCLTNPDVLKISIESVRKMLENVSKDSLISISQNDNYCYCTCEKCMALAEEEGSQAGPVIHFVNAIVREFPEYTFETLAYQYTRKPPKYVRPEKNLMIRLCSIECCFLHPMEDCHSESGSHSSFQSDLQEWARQTDKLYIWDYVINYAHTMAPFMNLRVLKPNINYMAANHVVGIYEEGNYFSRVAEMVELRTYLMMKFLWNPQYDENKAIYDFTNAYYGPAAPMVRKYIDIMHDAALADGEATHMHIFDNPKSYLKNFAALAEAHETLKAAAEIVKQDPVLTKRIEIVRLPILYARRVLNISPETRKDELDFIIRVGRENGLSHVSEGGTFEAWVNKQLAEDK